MGAEAYGRSSILFVVELHHTRFTRCDPYRASESRGSLGKSVNLSREERVVDILQGDFTPLVLGADYLAAFDATIPPASKMMKWSRGMSCCEFATRFSAVM